MEAATLFVQGAVYRLRTGCICAVIAQRTEGENVVMAQKDDAVEAAITVALEAVATLPAD